MSNVFVFRVNTESDCVKKEFKQGRLRQGWGNSTADMHLSQDEWVSNRCQKDKGDGNETYYRRKYKNHKIMLEIEAGDILIIPKFQNPLEFTICRAAGKYEFSKPDGFDVDDFYHMIPIDKSTVREFNYHADEDCEIIHAKFRAYQSPLNHVWNQTVRDSAEKLLKKESNKTGNDIGDIVGDIKSDIYKNALPRLRRLGSDNIEKIVDRIFAQLGYTQIGKNSWDKKGGDADLIYVSNSASEFLAASVNDNDDIDIARQKIYVQIKNKDDVDFGDTHGLEQLQIRTEDDLTAMKILISTADEFTEKCKIEASKKRILLIDSKGFLKLVFKYMD